MIGNQSWYCTSGGPSYWPRVHSLPFPGGRDSLTAPLSRAPRFHPRRLSLLQQSFHLPRQLFPSSSSTWSWRSRVDSTGNSVPVFSCSDGKRKPPFPRHPSPRALFIVLFFSPTGMNRYGDMGAGILCIGERSIVRLTNGKEETCFSLLCLYWRQSRDRSVIFVNAVMERRFSAWFRRWFFGNGSRGCSVSDIYLFSIVCNVTYYYNSYP